MVKRLAQAVTRLPAWVQDLALALALTVANVATLLFYRAQLHPFWLALTLVVLETLPLALRRRWPAATFVAAACPGPSTTHSAWASRRCRWRRRSRISP